jgi:hypothetical protein
MAMSDDDKEVPILRVVPSVEGGWKVERQLYPGRWWPVHTTMTRWGAERKMRRIQRRFLRLQEER